MPTTFPGLVIFVVFLLPGFISYVRRSRLDPARDLSPFMETANIVSVSVATNVAVLGLFGFIRWILPDHTPEPGRLVFETATYAEGRLGYLALWGVGLLVGSCALAALASTNTAMGVLRKVIPPIAVVESAWSEMFETPPDDDPDARAYVGLQLTSGTYVAGNLWWYSTKREKVPDRELTLVGPLEVVRGEGTDKDHREPLEEFDYATFSSRDIESLYLTWVKPDPSSD